MVISSDGKEKRQQGISISIRKVWSVALTNLQRWKNDHRIWLMFVFIGIFIVNELNGFVAYGLDTGEKCTAYMLLKATATKPNKKPFIPTYNKGHFSASSR